MEQYFIDYSPFGEKEDVSKPYITFNRLFGAASLYEYSEKYGVHIYYGDGFAYERMKDGFTQLKFTAKWQYPIRAIMRTLNTSHETIWHAAEENHAYVSKFYWNDGLKEDAAYILDDYYEWDSANSNCFEALQDYDTSAWHYIDEKQPLWENWASTDDLKRCLDVSAVNVKYPFKFSQ